MTSNYLIQFNNISKFFGKVIALKDVTMKLKKGEIMCLLGDNGAGKSTLIKTLAGVHKPDEGEIIIEGHTDSQGDDQFNQNLSQERADSIKQYMINAMLIPNYRIIATGYGETRPIANNETALGRQKNRRIDIVISSIVE